MSATFPQVELAKQMIADMHKELRDFINERKSKEFDALLLADATSFNKVLEHLGNEGRLTNNEIENLKLRIRATRLQEVNKLLAKEGLIPMTAKGLPEGIEPL